jgi:uncharacterized membrane protein
MKKRKATKPRASSLGDERFYLTLLLAILAATAIAISVFVVDLNRNFLISAADTSVFRNTLVNILHGHGFRVTAYSGPNLLGQHSAFVLLLIAPLYALIPSVDMLFTLQVWVVYSAVVPLYFIAQEALRKPAAAFLVALVGLTSPLLAQMAAAPFHIESGILAAVLWSYFFYRRNRAVGFWISFGLAVSCAEQAALIYIALGAALFFVDDNLAWRKSYAKYALIGGAAWLLFSMRILTPAMHSPAQFNVLRYHYSQWDVQSASELVVAVATDPLQALQYLLSPARWFYLLELAGVPLLLAFVFPRSLILLAPFPFFFLLCDHEFFLNFHAYYFQFAFFAGCVAMISFLARDDRPTGRGTVLLAAIIAANLLALIPVAKYFSGLAQGRDEALSSTLHAAFETIPPEAAVYTATRYCAYLSNRTNIVVGDLAEENFDFKARLDAESGFTGVPPEQIDYIVCDILNGQCGPRLGGFNPEAAKIRAENVRRYLDSGQWQVFWNQSNVVILRRAGK